MGFAEAIADTSYPGKASTFKTAAQILTCCVFVDVKCLATPLADVLSSPQDNIDGTDVLKKYATFHMRSGKTVEGVITNFYALGTSAEQSLYAVLLESRLAQRSHTYHCAIYKNVSVPELV